MLTLDSSQGNDFRVDGGLSGCYVVNISVLSPLATAELNFFLQTPEGEPVLQAPKGFTGI